jgi:ATP:ADP antiporter, AAA family
VRDLSRIHDGRSGLERFLGVFAEVRAGEGAGALLLALNVFVLLFSYYLIKTVREALILAEVGAANKVYLAVVISAVLVVYAQAFGGLARRLTRMRLVAGVTLFFASTLLVFCLLGAARVPVAIPFFVWVGVFNVSIVAQFWSFANDLCTEEQGERLFPLIAAGSALGAVAGGYGAARFYDLLGSFGLMLAAAVLLVLSLGVTWHVHRRHARGAWGTAHPEAAAAASAVHEPVGGSTGALGMVFRKRYLLLVAAITLLGTWVNTTGEFVFDRALLQVGDTAGLTGEAQRTFIGQWKGTFYAWVNGVVVVVQLFLVSRIFKRLGVRVALFVLPVVALGGYAAAFVVPALAVLFVVKVAENGLDYSLQGTLRHALFLVTSRAAKYKAKAAIDTVFFRVGDVLAAGVVLVGSHLALGTRGYIGVVVILLGAWLAVALALARLHARAATE